MAGLGATLAPQFTPHLLSPYPPHTSTSENCNVMKIQMAIKLGNNAQSVAIMHLYVA